MGMLQGTRQVKISICIVTSAVSSNCIKSCIIETALEDILGALQATLGALEGTSNAPNVTS